MTDQVTKYAREKMKQHSDLEEDIFELYRLYLTEIEDEGASKDHEAELFYGSVKELIEENENP